MVDRNTGNLLEAFRTNADKKRLQEPKALSSGKTEQKKSIKRRMKNVMIKVYVNGALLIICTALVFVAYRLAVIPEFFPPEVSANQDDKVVEVEQVDYQGAALYAHHFAFHWLSGNMERVKTYAATNFVFPEIEQGEDLPKNEVTHSEIWSVETKEKDKINVVIRAFMKTADDSESTVFLSVPMLVQDGKYGVYDLPTFVPIPEQATYAPEQKNSPPIPEEEQQRIRERINFFLDEYYGGDSNKMALYFDDGKPRAIVEGKLNDVDKIEFYELEAGNQNKVLAKVLAKVEIMGVNQYQRFELELVKKDEWRILNTDPWLPSYVTPKQEEAPSQTEENSTPSQSDGQDEENTQDNEGNTQENENTQNNSE